MSGLIEVGGDGGEACSFCDRPAAGPCASCTRPVCGVCSTLTEGGSRVWAICLECDRAKGRSLRRAWLGTAAWLGGILVVLALAVAVLAWLSER